MKKLSRVARLFLSNFNGGIVGAIHESPAKFRENQMNPGRAGGLRYSPAGSDSTSAHFIRRGVHRTPVPPPQFPHPPRG